MYLTGWGNVTSYKVVYFPKLLGRMRQVERVPVVEHALRKARVVTCSHYSFLGVPGTLQAPTLGCF